MAPQQPFPHSKLPRTQPDGTSIPGEPASPISQRLPPKVESLESLYFTPIPARGQAPLESSLDSLGDISLDSSRKTRSARRRTTQIINITMTKVRLREWGCRTAPVASSPGPLSIRSPKPPPDTHRREQQSGDLLWPPVERGQAGLGCLSTDRLLCSLCTVATLCRLKGTTQRSRPARASQHARWVTDTLCCPGGCLPAWGSGPCFHIPRRLGKRGGEHFSYQETEVLKDGPLVHLVRGTCGTSLMCSGATESSPSSVTLG